MLCVWKKRKKGRMEEVMMIYYGKRRGEGKVQFVR